jgi:hypothetical protein
VGEPGPARRGAPAFVDRLAARIAAFPAPAIAAAKAAVDVARPVPDDGLLEEQRLVRRAHATPGRPPRWSTSSPSAARRATMSATSARASGR